LPKRPRCFALRSKATGAGCGINSPPAVLIRFCECKTNQRGLIKMRRIISFLLLLIIYSAITPLRGLSEAKGPEAKKDKYYGGSLVWGVCYKPTIINPIFTTQSVSASLESLIFNSLIRWNAQGEIEPDLAESWGISEDGLVYTFHLRKGIRFHDGVECTAFDVKFTFDKFIDQQLNSPFRASFQLVKEFSTPDRYTFQILLTKASSSFIYRLIKEIVPEHLFEKSDIRNSPFNFHPVGTGPFRFKEWTKDDQIILEYNPDYYEGRPYLDKIIVKTYADSRELWTALMRQEVDLSLFIERQDYEILKNDPAFKTYALPVDGYYAMVYNLDDPILRDKRVRQAIAYGIDRKSLIEGIGSGYGMECFSPFYPGSEGFNPQVKAIEFNPDKAIALLSEAGWQDENKDGVLERNKKDLEIRMLVDERDEVYRKLAMLIRQELQVIGIKLTVLLYNDDSALTEEFLRKNKPQAQLKLLLAGINPDQEEEVWSSQAFGRFNNVWGYKNEQVKRYFVLGKTTTDKRKRKWIYQEIHRFIYEDQPVCFLYFPSWFHAVSSKFENTDEFFSLSMSFYSMKKWYVYQKIDKKERR